MPSNGQKVPGCIPAATVAITKLCVIISGTNLYKLRK